MARLKDLYIDEVRPAMMKKFSYKNIMECPKIAKICLNIGLGEALQNIKFLESGASDLATITGQKPVITKAKTSIAGFKLRAGNPIGCKVTLRGDRMFEFLDRLLSIAIPRIRDFRGVSNKAFDGRGNYTLGIEEQIIFPEINYDKVDKIRGMNITFVTSSKTDEEAYELLTLFGMPFVKRQPAPVIAEETS